MRAGDVLGVGVWIVATGCNRDWCGPGTVLRDDVCVAETVDPPVDENGRLNVSMPFAPGTEVYVIQGAHGYFSHYDESRYAVDWVVDEGTEVVAMRAGRVVALAEDSDTGCGTSDCASFANYVVLDHGDATFGEYLHLQQEGALVEIGQVVAQGEVIGLSGNTGFSTLPHLHVEIRDPLGQSLPLYWDDQPDGLVFAGETFVSGNTLTPAPGSVPWSSCPEDLLAFMGVWLDPGVPCGRIDEGAVVEITGEVLVDGAQVMLATWQTVPGAWEQRCIPVDSDGTFTLDASFGASNYQEYTYLMVAAADDSCATYQGWESSVPLYIH